MNIPKQSELSPIITKLTVKEDRVDEFYKIVMNDMVETRKEPGSLRTDFMRDKEKKNVFYINDTFLNEAAIGAHMATPHFL
jgi:quinol monooxygenase YgiN